MSELPNISGSVRFISENTENLVIIDEAQENERSEEHPPEEGENIDYESAYQEGWTAGKAEIDQELQQIKARLQDANSEIDKLRNDLSQIPRLLVEALNRYLTQFESQLKRDLRDTSFAIAEKIVYKQIHEDSAIWVFGVARP